VKVSSALFGLVLLMPGTSACVVVPAEKEEIAASVRALPQAATRTQGDFLFLPVISGVPN